MSLKIVIVGGVAGGASAAAKARRVNEQAEIVLFERGPYVSFANCGLPYYVSGDIAKRESLLLQTPESFWKRFRVRVCVRHEVVRIDRELKRVEVRNSQSGETFWETYDRLILSPGAGAIVPPLPGISGSNVFVVKTIPDSDAIRRFIEIHKPERAVVVGGGFIGVESAEALKRRGLDVTVVERLPQVLPPLDADMASFVSTHLEEKGVHVMLGDGIKAFHGEPMVGELELQSGKRILADLVILSIGVRPELQLAQDAGLTIGQAGGISVNDRQQTSDPSIYAAGDAAEVKHLVTQKKTRIPLAGPANKQGRVAGANAAGGDLTFPGALGTAIVETMGIAAAKTGLSERDAQQEGLAFVSTVTHSMDHAGYFPGGELLHMKVISDKSTGRLLGAQVVGEKGVDKRIDVFATALAAGLRVSDLENLDLAYAPQFSSAKDPVIIAGFVASNVTRQETRVIRCEELRGRLARHEPIQLIDVRTPAEFAAGHLDGAFSLPLDELRDRIHELDSTKETVVYCKVGLRGYLAARILQQSGFGNVQNLTGGLSICPDPSGPSAPSTLDGATVSVQVLRERIGLPFVVVLDVRENDEYAYEHIAGTQNFPLSQLAQWSQKVSDDKELYVFCQSGVRTQQAITSLRSQGFRRLHAVEGGLNAWKAARFPVQKRRGPIPIMRQVQIVAGAIAFLGGVIPGFHWIAALVGAGLVFAGLSGHCGLAWVLGHLPWNKTRPLTVGAPGGCGNGPSRRC